jgi:hypothetical protein
MGKGKAVEAAVVKPEELCLKLEEFFVSCKEALRLAAQKLPVKLNSSLLEISKHNLYYIMKQSEIKDLSAAVARKLSLTKKTYADQNGSCYFTN